MSKRTGDLRSKNSRPLIAKPTPSNLSEKLLAQLQQAVSAAQRTQNSDPSDASETSAVEKDLVNLIWRAVFSTAAPRKTQARRAKTRDRRAKS
jgi:hypothetical protein